MVPIKTYHRFPDHLLTLRLYFKNFDGLEAAPHEKAPRADIFNRLYYITVLIEKYGVDGKTHKKRMNRVALQYEHTFVMRQILRADKASHALEKLSRHLSLIA